MTVGELRYVLGTLAEHYMDYQVVTVARGEMSCIEVLTLERGMGELLAVPVVHLSSDGSMSAVRVLWPAPR